MTGKLNILACQIDVPATTSAAERDAHVKMTVAKVRACLDREQVDLVVLPELSTIDYGREAFERLDVLAEPLDGPSVAAFSTVAVAYGVTVVFGMPRRGREGCYISQVAVGPSGDVIGSFDKLHRAEFGLSEEKDFFLPGDHLTTFECRGLRVAPIICYDIRFPELIRTLVLDHGVDLILHCGAYGRDASFDTWHAFVTTRALENQVPVLSLNRAGALFGDSIYCDPWIDATHPPVRFPAHDEALQTVIVDSTRTVDAREKYTFLQDRLTSYSALKHAHGAQRDNDA